MEPLSFVPIATVVGGRPEVVDDDWGSVTARIVLDGTRFKEACLLGLHEFSHITVVYHFHQVVGSKIEMGARRPRNNPNWPEVGIFAQRGKNRPNAIGVSTCRLISVDRLTLNVQGLDAIDGTPVLDIKPCMTGFLPAEPLREPEWAREIMARYWKNKTDQ